MNIKTTIRLFSFEKDYPEVCEWWRGNGWAYVPKQYLPVTGLIAEHEGLRLCAVWLYTSGTAFGMMEWIVTNPRAPVRMRHAGVADCVSGIIGMSKSAGISAIWMSTKSTGLCKSLKRAGFKVSDESMTNLVYSGGI